MSLLLQKLYAYQAWANRELFEKLELIDRHRHANELQAVLGLIDHAHVVAEIFAGHLSGAGHPHISDRSSETPELGRLQRSVEDTDTWYVAYIGHMSAAGLAEVIPFRFTDGDAGFMTREEMLIHVALHGGYHRGEAGRILWQMSMSPPWDTFAVYLHHTEPARRLQSAPNLSSVSYTPR